MIGMIWLTSIIVSLAPLFGWKDEDSETRVEEHKLCLVRSLAVGKDYRTKVKIKGGLTYFIGRSMLYLLTANSFKLLVANVVNNNGTLANSIFVTAAIVGQAGIFGVAFRSAITW